MHPRGSAFLKIGITLVSFKDSGKIPFTKNWLMSLEIGILIFVEYFLRSLVGILFGPIDFCRFNVLITSLTSSGNVGVQKKVFFWNCYEKLVERTA